MTPVMADDFFVVCACDLIALVYSKSDGAWLLPLPF